MLKVSQNFINRFNHFVSLKEAFVFLIDFEGEKPLIFSPDEASKNGLLFQTKDIKNFKDTITQNCQAQPISYPTDSKDFNHKFKAVQKHLQNGDTYLLNLTFKTPINLNCSLKDIFYQAKAPYKIYLKNSFVCFSPETFVRTKGNRIFTYPMKGTIDATLSNALKKLLSDKKETYEHYTIVDLLRNDLSCIATQINVDKFRYADRIKTSSGDLYQISSQISGILPENWQKHAAEFFLKILPAGSISGAPKTKTIEIIQNLESEKRGYYTGIFGYFDGQNFDSAVLIRYIEQVDGQYFYRSGGGITALSNSKDEYNELKQKIYVPTD